MARYVDVIFDVVPIQIELQTKQYSMYRPEGLDELTTMVGQRRARIAGRHRGSIPPVWGWGLQRDARHFD